MPRRSIALAATAGLLSALALLGIATASSPAPTATQAAARSCTTDAAGYCTVTHDLGVIPDAVLLTPTIAQGATAYTLSVTSTTAMDVRVRAVKAGGGALANSPIRFSMLALGQAAPTTTTTPPVTTTTPPVTTTTVPPATTTTTTTPPPAGCALPNYPDASCTGVPPGTVLTAMTGDFTITTPNTVIDGKDIHGCVTVKAPGVVIRNSRIACTGFYTVDSWGYTGTGLVIQDSEIHCNDANGTAIGEENVTAQRVNVHGCENGFDVDKSFTIEDSYVHDLYQAAVAHTDGVQMWSTVDGVTIRHNRIYADTNGVAGTSAIISSSTGTANVLIQDNLLAGGAFTLYCRQNGPGTNYRVIGNHFSTVFSPKVGAYGPWTDCQDEAQVTGNVYHESGQPVPF